MTKNHLTLDQTLDGLLQRIGYGTFHKKLLLLCGLGWLADNMWLQTIVIILPRVQETYHVPDNLIGILSSSLFAGMTLGAFFWGSYSDTKGRKGPYTLTLLFTSIFSVLSCFTRSFFTLCICMVFIGFGVGGNMPTDGALYLEFLPKKYHYLLTFMSIFFSLGAVLASFLGYVILPCEEACDRWRTLLFVASIITFVMLTLRSFLIQLPESPKFLLNHGRIEETLSVLQKIAKINGTQVHINKDELKTREQIEDESTPLVEEKEKKKLQALKELMSPKWRRTTVFVWFLWTFTCIGFTTFNVFLPKYLQATHDDPIKPDQSQVYWDYMIYSLVGVPGSIIASSFIETRLGRKGTMALSAFGSSIALLVFSNTQSRSIMVASSSSVSFLGTLLYAVIYGYTPETFETSVRGTAIGTASALGRIAGIISPVLGGSLFLIDTSLPLYVSIIAYSMAGISILLLP